MFARSGTSVWVCDPQSVYTAFSSWGWAGLSMLKMRIPSKHASPHAVVSLVRLGLHVTSPAVWGVSFERNR